MLLVSEDLLRNIAADDFFDTVARVDEKKYAA